MKLSSKTHYGLMACYVLGNAYPKKQVSAMNLSNEIGVSGKYLEQMMRKLAANNIVTASRGARGGYYLARTPEDISIGEIVRALENNIEIIECVKQNPKCKCCPSAIVWKKLHKGINEFLDAISLKQLIDGELQW